MTSKADFDHAFDVLDYSPVSASDKLSSSSKADGRRLLFAISSAAVLIATISAIGTTSTTSFPAGDAKTRSFEVHTNLSLRQALRRIQDYGLLTRIANDVDFMK